MFIGEFYSLIGEITLLELLNFSETRHDLKHCSIQ